MDEYMISAGLARQGDIILLVAGKPLGVPRVVNSLFLHRVGERGLGFSA